MEPTSTQRAKRIKSPCEKQHDLKLVNYYGSIDAEIKSTSLTSWWTRSPAGMQIYVRCKILTLEKTGNYVPFNDFDEIKDGTDDTSQKLYP